MINIYFRLPRKYRYCGLLMRQQWQSMALHIQVTCLLSPLASSHFLFLQYSLVECREENSLLDYVKCVMAMFIGLEINIYIFSIKAVVGDPI